MKNQLKAILKGLILLLATLFCILFVKINFCSPVVYVVVALFVGVGIYLLFFYKKKWGALLFLGAFLVMNLLSAIFSDGLIFGNRIDYKYVLLRGGMRIIFDDNYVSEEQMYKMMFPELEYREDGTRITEWKPSSDYTFESFVQDGVILEVLTPNECNDRVVLMLHGGAYKGRMMDNFNEYLVYYSEANGGSKVVSVDYKVMPYTYKEIIGEVITTYEWLMDEGYSPDQIVIAGDSAGGGLALASSLYMRDNNIPLPKGIVTLSAWTNLACNTDSFSANTKIDPNFGGHDLIQKLAIEYVGDDDVENPYISPYYGDFTGFPPVLMQAGSYERLLDDSKDLVESALQQGQDFTLEVYDGVFHEFQMFKGDLRKADEAWESIEAFLDQLYLN